MTDRVGTTAPAGSGLSGGALTLVLASASPRRARLLAEHGYRFEVVTPDIDEPPDPTSYDSPAQVAAALSYYKARNVGDRVARGVVLGADTIAAAGGRIFGKPADRDDARRILTCLLGTRHEVITGVTLLNASTGDRMIRTEATWVHMRVMPGPELEAYLDSGAWCGKAGAYGIQDHGDAFVDHIEGSFTNIVGLPMELLARMLDEFCGDAGSDST